ncbi:hypothetical protein RD792_016932 [Penstemon davidsonii]|uniref:CRM domain-containing protein n=1 Tax=Penstemon davidsonii TaxID=160366 RepID=A0ABR0CLX3_9LAMI|nr:hypothetical protein RD792_016932 [Penstemon davidsonii]
MSAASPFLSHGTNAITPYFSFNPSKFSFITFCTPPINHSNSTTSESRSSEHESEHFYAKSSKPISHSVSAIKAPTPPWMNEPLLVKSNEILEFSKRKTRKDSTFRGNNEHPDMGLTGKVGGGRGKVAMKKIFKSFEKLQETQNLEQTGKNPENIKFKFAPGDLWGNGGYQNGPQIEENYLESSGFDIPLAEIEKEWKLKKMPWEKDEKMVIVRRMEKEKKRTTTAELSVDVVLLERLRGEAAIIKKWVKVKKAGVNQGVIDQVRFIWRNNELALLKFDIPLCRNMDRAREIVEAKTGGVVVWSNKDFLAVYRGCKYLSNSKDIWTKHHNSTSYQESPPNGKWESSSLYERESDRLLDGLGPRFVDWWMQKPLPVDADLLPEVVPGLKTPVRLSLLCPRSKLTDAELTQLRKLARPLPTHFVLGRNRKLQGLAAAILKLWEKCHIAKIAVKWGIQNTDNEQMANELKASVTKTCYFCMYMIVARMSSMQHIVIVRVTWALTGGTLLLRNKFFIILYRGKDFVPSEVANLVSEREMELASFQNEEEAARLKASDTFSTTYEDLPNSGIIGTLSEFHSIQLERKNLRKENPEVDVQLEAEREKLEKELKNQERKLFIVIIYFFYFFYTVFCCSKMRYSLTVTLQLKKKIEKSVITIEKLNQEMRLSEQDADQETISREERECLRAIGRKIDSTLVLGRRGVYDGVIEGIHQHWKHREIVKVITMQKKISQVIFTAKRLETESGGILVSVFKLKEGHAIIIYRGKNYKRPKSASQNLLTKREALFRSLEIQRIGSLKFFAHQREQAIYDLKRKLVIYTCYYRLFAQPLDK